MAMSERVSQVLLGGRTTFPTIRIADLEITPTIRQRLENDEPSQPIADADELFLAAACAAGDRDAIAIFERRYFTVIRPALSAMALSRDELADIEQSLRIRLFVAEPRVEANEPPRVVSYAGAGQLGGLVRVAAVRLGLNRLRDRGRIESDDDGFERMISSADAPDLQHLKVVHRDAMRQAFAESIATLAPRQRTLLRMTYVSGTTIDGLAQIYGVHRGTAARWVAQARDTLGATARRLLAAKLGVAIADVDDSLPLLESQLELSLERLLKTNSDGSPLTR
jgi:RNA polymerase sigma-70 factor, ECF subfamily